MAELEHISGPLGRVMKSFLNGCIDCGKPTLHPEDRAILRCEACAEKFEPLPNIKRVKKAVKEVKS